MYEIIASSARAAATPVSLGLLQDAPCHLAVTLLLACGANVPAACNAMPSLRLCNVDALLLRGDLIFLPCPDTEHAAGSVSFAVLAVLTGKCNNHRNKDRALRELATLRLYVCNKERERHHTLKDREILQTDRWNLIETLKAKVHCMSYSEELSVILILPCTFIVDDRVFESLNQVMELEQSDCKAGVADTVKSISTQRRHVQAYQNHMSLGVRSDSNRDAVEGREEGTSQILPGIRGKERGDDIGTLLVQELLGLREIASRANAAHSIWCDTSSGLFDTCSAPEKNTYTLEDFAIQNMQSLLPCAQRVSSLQESNPRGDIKKQDEDKDTSKDRQLRGKTQAGNLTLSGVTPKCLLDLKALSSTISKDRHHENLATASKLLETRSFDTRDPRETLFTVKLDGIREEQQLLCELARVSVQRGQCAREGEVDTFTAGRNRPTPRPLPASPPPHQQSAQTDSPPPRCHASSATSTLSSLHATLLSPVLKRTQTIQVQQKRSVDDACPTDSSPSFSSSPSSKECSLSSRG